MHKFFFIFGTLAGAFAVMIGAFGAHALSNFLESSGRTETFETAVKYQFYHALALIMLGMVLLQFEHRFLTYSGYAFTAGMVIFSGSLYALCVSGITKLGMITPIGGLLLIAGWLLFALGLIKVL